MKWSFKKILGLSIGVILLGLITTYIYIARGMTDYYMHVFPYHRAARDLIEEWHMWLEDGCPIPPVATNYIILLPPELNYTCTNTLVFEGKTNHPLFAMKRQYMTNTYVIATTGDIFAIDGLNTITRLKKLP